MTFFLLLTDDAAAPLDAEALPPPPLQEYEVGGFRWPWSTVNLLEGTGFFSILEKKNQLRLQGACGTGSLIIKDYIT